MKQLLVILTIGLLFTACNKPTLDIKCSEMVVTEVSAQAQSPILTKVLADTSMQMLVRSKGYSYKDRLDLCGPDGSAYIVVLGTPAGSASQAFLFIRYSGDIYTSQLVERYESMSSSEIRVVLSSPGQNPTDITFDPEVEGKKGPCKSSTNSLSNCMRCAYDVMTNDIVGVLAFAFMPHVTTAAMLIHCA